MKFAFTSFRPLCACTCAVLLYLPARQVAAAPHSLDTTFSVDGKATVDYGAAGGVSNGSPPTALVQGDGKVVFAGTLKTATTDKFTLARLKADGTPDTTFGSGGKVSVRKSSDDEHCYGVAVQPDGKLIAVGSVWSVFEGNAFGVARFTAAGALDTTFGTGGWVSVDFGSLASVEAGLAVTVQPDGKILVAGYTDAEGSGFHFGLMRLTSSGVLDNTFGTGGKVETLIGGALSVASLIALQPDGKILVGGYSTGATYDFAVARYTSAGVLDTTFSGDGMQTTHFSGNESPSGMKLLPDGKILLAGSMNGSHACLAKYRTDGELDTTFDGDGKLTILFSHDNSTVRMDVQPGGKIVLAGTSSTLVKTMRRTSTGSADTTFAGGAVMAEAFDTPSSGPLTAKMGRVIAEENGRIVVVGAAVNPSEPSGGAYSSDFTVLRYEGDATPDIALEQPMATSLQDGFSTVDFGGMLPGATVTKTFTIRNTGLVMLGLDPTPVTLSGPGAGFFTVAQPAFTAMAPGATRTFTVQVGPAATGSRTATLHVGSSDPDEDTFDVVLKVDVSEPVSFESPAYVVVEGDSVDIKVKRGSAGGAVTVGVKSTGGTAVAGTHYAAVNQTVTFDDANAEETLTFTPLDNGAGDATKTVVLTLSGGTAPKGPTAGLTTTVRIIDLNSVAGGTDILAPPTPATVSTPANGGVVRADTGGPVTITGTATDNRAVKEVEVSIDDFLTFSTAVLAAPGAASTGYTAQVVPVGGSVSEPFAVRVRTRDYVNHETVSPQSPVRTFRVRRPLAITAGAGGTVPASVVADPYYEPGTSVTITATPGAGKLFDRWMVGGLGNASLGGVDFATNLGLIGITEAAREVSKLTFTMQEGLTLEATFIDNPFTAVAGTYIGLVRTDPVNTLTVGGFTPPGNHSEGAITLTLQPTGAFSGTVSVDGRELRVAGVFDGDMEARFGPTRTKELNLSGPGSPLITLTLRLEPGGAGLGDEAVSGALVAFYRTYITAISVVRACRKHYTGTAPYRMPAGFLADTTTFADGRVTAHFPMKALSAQPAVMQDEQYYPQGHGYLSMTVSKTGLMTYSGRLADDSVFSGSTTATPDSAQLVAPLHIPLYGKRGCFIALLELNASAGTVVNFGDALWFRPYQDVHHYPDGWPEGLHLDVTGGVYRMEAGKSVLDGTTTATRGAELHYTWGRLPAVPGIVSRAITVTKADVVTDSDAILTTTINRTTGVITGNFPHVDGSTTLTRPYYGVVRQQGTNPRGFGYFMSKTPTVKDYTGEGGKVELEMD